MNAFANDPALRLYALVSCLVAVHLMALAGLTGRARTTSKRYVNPEDASTFKGQGVESDSPEVLRVRRAHLNAIENAVPFFAVGLLYALSGPSMLGAQAYFWTFLGARVLHSVFYLAGKQPFRTICFTIGTLATFGMAVHVIRALL